MLAIAKLLEVMILLVAAAAGACSHPLISQSRPIHHTKPLEGPGVVYRSGLPIEEQADQSSCSSISPLFTRNHNATGKIARKTFVITSRMRSRLKNGLAFT